MEDLFYVRVQSFVRPYIVILQKLGKAKENAL